MKLLLGIIIIYLIVIWRSKTAVHDRTPIIFTFTTAVVVTGYVFYMMVTMEVPG
jgi:hypothetical protein